MYIKFSHIRGGFLHVFITQNYIWDKKKGEQNRRERQVFIYVQYI